MRRVFSGISIKKLVQYLAAILLLSAVAVTLSAWPGVKVMAGAVPEDEHEDTHMEGEGVWQKLPYEQPQGLEIVPINGKNTLTTGTNDFYISAWRDTEGNWQILPGGETVTAIVGKSDEELLLGKLQQEWEFKMKIPAEVVEKMDEGYAVGVAVSEFVKKEDFKASMKDLNLSDLFFLEKELHYKFEDEYLCIKGYPQVRMRDDVSYYDVVQKF